MRTAPSSLQYMPFPFDKLRWEVAKLAGNSWGRKTLATRTPVIAGGSDFCLKVRFRGFKCWWFCPLSCYLFLYYSLIVVLPSAPSCPALCCFQGSHTEWGASHCPMFLSIMAKGGAHALFFPAVYEVFFCLFVVLFWFCYWMVKFCVKPILNYIVSLLVLKGESVLAITKHCNLGCRNLFLPGLGTEKLTFYQQIWRPARVS